MRQSGELNRIYWFFLTIFILLIYLAIIVWADTLIQYKLLAGGIFALVDMALFAALKDAQVDIEKAEDQKTAELLGQGHVKELQDGSKVYVDALPSPAIETIYWCPKCKEVKRAGQVWGGAANKLCMKCDTLAMPIVKGSTIFCTVMAALYWAGVI